MRIAMRYGVLAGIVLVGACSSTTEPVAPPSQLEELPRALSQDERVVVSANHSFAFGILRETIRRDAAPNVLLSPLSASLALSIALNGAAGTTHDEMRAALGFGAEGLDRINAANESLTELLLGLDRSVDMRIANSVWSRAGFPFEQAFMDAARRWYSAQVTTLDFSAPTAAPTINEWVDRATNGRITEIVDPAISPDLVMFIINAVYFKGSWRDRFDRAFTRDAPFTLADGSMAMVPMMNRTGTAHYHRAANGTEILEQVYSRGAFAMTIVLPPAETPIDDVIATLDQSTWNAWMEALRETEAEISMPRYRVEYTSEMNDALQALGIRSAFNDADFTPMSPLGRRLAISRVLQKTFMDVNEEGTEAAAVTSVGIGVTSMPSRPRVVVDRPFIVAIRERFSGSILFIGRIGRPAQ